MKFLPVTCVKFIPDCSRILSASGNEVNILDYSNKKIINKLTLNKLKIIHGIELNGDIAIVYGGFLFCICIVNDFNHILYSNVFQHQNDFILDCMIYFNQGNEIRFCVSLAHGSTHFYRFQKEERKLLSLGEAMIAEERSLLYCCHLFRNKAAVNDVTNVFLAGGGVQNEIFIWDISTPDNSIDKRVRTLSRLNGHKGAIFGIHLTWDDSLLVTMGDDRNVILWKALSKLSCDENTLDNIQWVISRILIGHDARVWGGMSLPNDDSVIAWGEDCSVRFWDRNGINQGCITPHTGRSVWSGDVKINNDNDNDNDNDKYLIVTGGNDGAVVVSEFQRTKEKGEFTNYDLDDKLDFPRRLIVLQSGNVLIVTDLGRFYITVESGNKGESSIVKIECNIDENLIKHYCFIYEYDHSGGIILLGNMFGCLMVARLQLIGDLCFHISCIETFELSHKIMAIDRAVGTDVLISLNNGQMISLTRLESGHFSTHNHVSLISGWATCWVQWERIADSGEVVTHFVCGDRDGRLHSFEMEYNSEMELLSVVSTNMRKLCNKSSGITCLVWHEKYQRIYVGNKSGDVWSLDGYTLVKDIVMLKNPDILGWTCRIELLDNDGGDDGLIITGFKSVLFRRVVVHGNGQHPVVVMEQLCGGGHREWDIYTSQSNIRKLAFIQTRSVHVVAWGSQCAQPIVIKPHLHGKEINLCSFVENSNQLVLLSGSEDCSLALVTLDRQNDQYELRNVQRIHGHISSVRCVTELEDLIVSAGGRGQIIFWSMDRVHHSMRVVASTLLPKLINSSTDTRIMDMCPVVHGQDSMVAIGGSCGSLMFVSLPKNSIRPKFEMEYRVSNSCISNVSFVRSLLISSSTDGKVHWFPFSRNPVSHKSYQLGKSALLGMDTTCSSICDSISVSVGGDDGSVAVARFRLDNNSEWDLEAGGHAQYFLAHSGSTVATRWLHGSDNDDSLMRFVSLGSDGRLILWKANFQEEFIELLMIRCISSCVGVTDPHTMAVTKHALIESRFSVYVVGMGAHLFEFDLESDDDE